MPKKHESRVVLMPDGNYQHQYGIQHRLPVNWWYTTDLPVFRDLSDATLTMQMPLVSISYPDPTIKKRLDQSVVDEWCKAFLSGTTKDVSPYSVFVDMTYLGKGKRGQARGEIVEAHCSDREALAFIDCHPDKGWVFHSLYELNTFGIRKKKISDLFVVAKTRRDEKTELDLENSLAQKLSERGYFVRRQVSCASGIADIVTEEAVYELKVSLTRHRVFEAVGQVLLYRQDINPSLRAVIAGPKSHENIDTLLATVSRLGIEIEVLE